MHQFQSNAFMKINGIIGIAAVFILIGCNEKSFAQEQARIYVSPDGTGDRFTNENPGNLFAARDLIRTMNQKMTGDIIVYLKGGEYNLTRSFTLRENNTIHDSGTEGYNIVYQAAPGEIPVLSSGKYVRDWELHDANKNIYRAFVGKNVDTRRLFVNGNRALRCRGRLDPPGFDMNKDGTGFTTTNTEMQSWRNKKDVEFVQRYNFRMFRVPVASINGSQIIMQEPAWSLAHSGKTSIKMNKVCWIENAYELLLSPGMWYLDKS